MEGCGLDARDVLCWDGWEGEEWEWGWVVAGYRAWEEEPECGQEGREEEVESTLSICLLSFAGLSLFVFRMHALSTSPSGLGTRREKDHHRSKPRTAFATPRRLRSTRPRATRPWA